MRKKTDGMVIETAVLWGLKVNTKPVRLHALDGATFPHMAKVRYGVDGIEYTKGKYIGVGTRCPEPGEAVSVYYEEDAPSRCKIVLKW